MANPEEDDDVDDEDGETELKPSSTTTKSTVLDGVGVGNDDIADDESQRGRRHLPPHWKVRK